MTLIVNHSDFKVALHGIFAHGAGDPEAFRIGQFKRLINHVILMTPRARRRGAFSEWRGDGGCRSPLNLKPGGELSGRIR